MKVAIAADRPNLASSIAPTFGRAAYFVLIDVESGRYQIHNNAPHIKAHHAAGIRTAGALIDLDVDVVLTNSIGPKAFATLRAGYAEIYDGLSGTVARAITRFKAGELVAAPLPNATGHCGDDARVDTTQLPRLIVYCDERK